MKLMAFRKGQHKEGLSVRRNCVDLRPGNDFKAAIHELRELGWRWADINMRDTRNNFEDNTWQIFRNSI
jgi:hypothetical protein